MENIVTYLIFQFSKIEEAQIRTWLDCGHFPNAIDRERHRIIVFNINRETMLGFVNQFHIHDWTFGQSAAQPNEYTELFRFYDSVLWENIAAYRFFSMGNDYKPFSTISDRYQTLSTGFMHDGYKAWRTRFYLSRGLLGLSAKTLKPSKYTPKRSGETKIFKLKSKLQEALDEASEEYALCFDPDAELVIRFWIDYDPYRKYIKRIYIGWMSDSDRYINCREFVQNLKPVSVWMQNWLKEKGLPHNTTDDDGIENFLKNSGLTLSDFENEGFKAGNVDGYRYSKDMYPLILDTVSIPFLPWEKPENLGVFKSFAYTIDRERNIIVIFNLRKSLCNILKTLNDKSLLRVITYTEGILPQYKELYEYVNDKIRNNLKERTNPEQWIFNLSSRVGMSAYYQRLQSYNGLQDIDLNRIIDKNK